MKYINKIRILSIILTACLLTGCGYSKFNMPFGSNSSISSFNMVSSKKADEKLTSFAQNLCVVEGNIDSESISDFENAAGGLFDVNGRDTIYASNIHETMYPASLTKVLTAIVAIKNSSPSDLLTASGNVNDLEAGAQVVGLKEGSQLTMEQALHILLIYSANDVAILIAESVGGTVDNFVEMMNSEAKRLGASNSHFSNPHGLNSEDHYTTPYDMYLIMNEAVKLSQFKEIIMMKTYQTSYFDASGKEKSVDINSTNLYLDGSINAPSGVTVLGGKTGTTSAAGHCLVLYTKDTSGNPYISIVMKTKNRDDLYSYTNQLLEKIK